MTYNKISEEVALQKKNEKEGFAGLADWTMTITDHLCGGDAKKLKESITPSTSTLGKPESNDKSANIFPSLVRK